MHGTHETGFCTISVNQPKTSKNYLHFGGCLFLSQNPSAIRPFTSTIISLTSLQDCAKQRRCDWHECPSAPASQTTPWPAENARASRDGDPVFSFLKKATRCLMFLYAFVHGVFHVFWHVPKQVRTTTQLFWVAWLPPPGQLHVFALRRKIL